MLTTIDSQKPKTTPDFVFKKPSEEQIKNVLILSKKSTKPLVIVLRGNPEKLLKKVFSEFKYISAAGGIVENAKGRVLLMKRAGKWDLPKGKTEKGEDIETCALREIEEETGAKELEIISSFDDTFHTYFRNNKWMLKHTFWYRVVCHKDDELEPQTSEDIQKVKWVKKKKLIEQEIETYPAIKYLLKNYLKE